MSHSLYNHARKLQVYYSEKLKEPVLGSEDVGLNLDLAAYYLYVLGDKGWLDVSDVGSIVSHVLRSLMQLLFQLESPQDCAEWRSHPASAGW